MDTMEQEVTDLDLELPDADEFQVAMPAKAKQRIESWLHGDQAPDALERGLMCVLTRSPGTRRLTYLVREVVPPEPGDLELKGGVEFKPGYRRRVKRRANSNGGGVLYLHTHPGGEGRPSRKDVEGARRLLHNDAQHLDNSNPPLAIGIVTPDDDWMVLGAEFPKGTALSGGTARFASAVRVIGESFRKIGTYTGDGESVGAAGGIGSLDPATQNRQIRLWNRDAQATYAGLRIGIVGLGGGGSILAEHVARAGVDSLVLADYDVIKKENLNRQQGATSVDASVWRPKVEVAARSARKAATNPDFHVERVAGSVVEHDPKLSAFRALLDCDVILHSADGHWTTQVLDRVAYAYLIPVIKGGTRPETTAEGVLEETTRSPITLAGPGHPCLRCTDQFSPDKAEEERHGGRTPGPAYGLGNGEEREALNDEENAEPAPSVISLNAIVAGLMHLRLQDLTLGITGNIVGVQRFLPGAWDFEQGRDRCRKDCDRGKLIAAGESHIFPLSRDHEFRELRNEVSVRFTPYWE